MNYLTVFLAITGSNFAYSGYIYDKGLGTECLYDEDCITRNSFCKGNKICACKIGFQYDPGSDVCFPRELGLKCTEDYDCSAIENSKCSFDRCQCRADYVPSKDKNACLPSMRLTEICEEDSQCSSVMNRSFCDPVMRQCVCEKGLRRDFYRKLCIEEQRLPNSCTNKFDCETRSENIGRVECVPTNSGLMHTCRCIEGYEEQNGICFPKDGSSHAVLSLPAFATLLLVKWLV